MKGKQTAMTSCHVRHSSRTWHVFNFALPQGLEGMQIPPREELFSKVTVEDEQLARLNSEKAAACLEANPGVLAILTEAWEKQSFKELRKLGTFS
jgi:hypothetical protein